ncbi:ATP phosphoribosyltransferase regulatory subunit [Wenxinia marina]|uniref:Histidine--tRNA ligase n=1 Tax=Wenxinia marina DSM 24838 TaxID=1123501 RepID=A0A0D0NGY2_9RHOB|nr:ATP phosphoribosyltransferase regulatory subunit [Wenxinia marina]KIQ67595.1 ATP phosphoribosyltransferase involved in histidine biosynthesis [Wenxinia marina DSM 24838]GGL68222.1 ATP phosphoribosyltransferase regulatory subunit [Wenxinia marina]
MTAAPTPDLRAEAARLSVHFRAAGAQPVEAAILQPADVLLDLYGEDIRARAYVTADPLRGEMMLRPDFTVPVVQMHMESGADPARYTYAGEVFRRQEVDEARANEYVQVGFELFGGDDPAEADAEVFATVAGALSGLGLTGAIGDVGLLIAAVRGLRTTEARKAALLRHIWRPRRFRALLDRFGGRGAVPPSRVRLLGLGDPFDGAGPDIGKRSRAEVEARIAALREDAAAPPLSDEERALLDEMVAIRAPAPDALSHLRDLAVDLPATRPAVARMAARLDAMARRGIDVGTLQFEGSYGRTALEYYDGFVFGLVAEGRPELPPVATGGRYDALTKVLGQGRSVPAVGGVIRPDLALVAGGGA